MNLFTQPRNSALSRRSSLLCRLLALFGFLFIGIASSHAIDLGLARTAELSDPTAWEQTTAGLTSPANNALIESSAADTLTFITPEPGKQMRWRSPLRPVWLDTHSYLTIAYTATGLNAGVSWPLLRLRTGPESWFTALPSTSIQSNGEPHELTINLRSLTTTAQISGIQLEIASDAETSASFQINRFEFTDQPPGYLYPPPPLLSPATTLYDVPITTGEWAPQPTWLAPANVATTYSITADSGTLAAWVGDASRAMKWYNISIGTYNLPASSWVLMRYRARNLRPSSTDYALYLRGTSESRPFYLADLKADNMWRWAAAPAGLDYVNAMAIQVSSSARGDASLEISELRFVDRDPRIDLSFYTSIEEGWDKLSTNIAEFDFLDLSPRFNARADQLLPRMSLNVPWFQTTDVCAARLAPFRIRTESPNLVATDIPGLSSITLPVYQSTSEIFLLIASHLPGREESFIERMVMEIDETERFACEVIYSDGSSEEFFPAEIGSLSHRLYNQTFTAVSLPADPARVVKSIHLHDRTDGGLFALAAVTIRKSGARLCDTAFSVPPADEVTPAPPPPMRSPSIHFTSPTLTLENTYFRYSFELGSGLALRQWESGFTGQQIIPDTSDGRFFSGTLGSSPFTSLDFAPFEPVIENSGSHAATTVSLALRGQEGVIGATLTARIDESSQAQFSLKVHNNGATSQTFELKFPDLPHLHIGPQPDRLHYAYPSLPMLLGSEPVDTEQRYSGNFPMQFLDLYDTADGWGIYFLTQDLNLTDKYYRLRKGNDSAGVSVRYPALPATGLPAGGEFEAAPTVIALHAGDWKAAFDAYRNWTSIWYAERSPRQQWFQEVYTCRRDYPINGSGRLFDRPANSYTMPAELDDARRWLGGVDMIDISSWAWSATYGRVGDYRRYELGGLEDFRSAITTAADEQVPVGLYIEGYLVDRRSDVYAQHGLDWRRENAAGNEIFNGPNEIEFCPYAPGWRQHMSNVYRNVLTETTAAAMYIDQFGTFFQKGGCSRSDHGHAPGQPVLRGEYQFTRDVRQALNEARSGVPIYTEFTPVDFISQFQDGSFSYAIYQGNNFVSPTETNLFRFGFLTFKQIELVNGGWFARNWTEEGLKKAFFNGSGIWIKGDLPSWYDANTIGFYRKSHEIWSDHRDAFTTSSPEPFLPALISNLYAHRFAAEGKQIITLYNANWRDIKGELIRADAAADSRFVDLWQEKQIHPNPDASANTISATLPPREIGCIGIFRHRFDASYSSDTLQLTNVDAPPASTLELVGVSGNDRHVRQIADFQSGTSIDLTTLFSPMPETLLVKLKQHGLVLDMTILHPQQPETPARAENWDYY